MLLGKKMGWNELDDLKACFKFIQVSWMVYFFQLYHSTRTVGFNFLFHFYPCYFLTYFPDFYEIGSVTECGRSLSSLGNQHRTGLYTFWSWGGVCAQFSSQHFSPHNSSSTDAKAHYWTASMVINSNFSSTSFWPPINPCCFVIQSWDMFQQYKIWHFKTISVPPPQLSVTSRCLTDEKNLPVCFRVR